MQAELSIIIDVKAEISDERPSELKLMEGVRYSRVWKTSQGLRNPLL